MHFVALLLFLQSASAAALATRQADSPERCYDGIYILNMPYHGGASPGIMTSLIDEVEDRTPDSYHEVVAYDSSNANYSIGIQDGVKKLTSAVKRYAKKCPDRPMMLSGHSEGGIVVMNTICDTLSTKYVPNIVSIIPYGESTFVPGQVYDRGTCNDGPSDHPREDPSTCLPWKKAIRSYCNEGDGVCCVGEGLGDHFSYPEYDDDAASHTLKRFNQFEKRQKSK